MNKKRASGGAFQLDARQHAALTNCVFHSCIMLAAKAHLCLCACMYISISISLLAPRCVYARVEWARPFSARCLRTCNPLIFAKYVTSLSLCCIHGAQEKEQLKKLSQGDAERERNIIISILRRVVCEAAQQLLFFGEHREHVCGAFNEKICSQ